MPITRERQSNYSEWEACRGGDLCAGKFPGYRYGICIENSIIMEGVVLDRLFSCKFI